MSEAPLDPDVARLREHYARNVDNRAQAAMLAVLAVLAMLYPVVLRQLVEEVGVRTVATLFAIVGAVSTVRAPDMRQRALRAAASLPALASAISGSIGPLTWIPALLYASLAYAFLASLEHGIPMVERIARTIQPAVPDFIAPYCRRVTALWGVVFVVNAVVLAMSALLLPIATWERIASVGIWTWMGVLTVGEFFVRKTYFRNYWYRGPFERFWSKLFPAEATPMGRRSAEHIRETRRKLGLDD